MGRELLNPSALHPAPGFSHITIATGSRTIYFAGQVALDGEFNIIGEGDLRAQTVAACNIPGAVHSSGRARCARSRSSEPPQDLSVARAGEHAVAQGHGSVDDDGIHARGEPARVERRSLLPERLRVEDDDIGMRTRA